MTNEEKIEFTRTANAREFLKFLWSQGIRSGPQYDQAWQFYHQFHPQEEEQQKDPWNAVQSLAQPPRYTPSEAQPSAYRDELERVERYIAKYGDEKMKWVFNQLMDRKPHHEKDLYDLMHLEKKWENYHDLRKTVSQIRDALKENNSRYEIPKGKAGIPAIYQLIIKKV